MDIQGESFNGSYWREGNTLYRRNCSLSKKLSEARNELQICRKNGKDLEERLTRSEKNAASEKQCRCFNERVSEVNLRTNEQRASDVRSEGSPEIWNRQIDPKCQETREEIEILQSELSVLRKERQHLLAQVEELERRQPFSIDDS